MEGKHPAGTRLRVALIPEEGLHPGRFVHERQFVCANVRDILWQPGRVAPGLFRHPGERRPDFLRLHHPHGFAIHEQQVICKAGFQRELAHRHAVCGVQVHPEAVLYCPAGGGQLVINIFPGNGFRRRHDKLILRG